MTSRKDQEPESIWSEWWIILAIFAVALAMVAAGILVFPDEKWLLNLGLLLAGVGVYGVVHELLGLVISKLEGRTFLFMLIITVVFGALIVNGYWLLNTP